MDKLSLPPFNLGIKIQTWDRGLKVGGIFEDLLYSRKVSGDNGSFASDVSWRSGVPIQLNQKSPSPYQGSCSLMRHRHAYLRSTLVKG